MGRARDLTMGPRRPRARIGQTGDYAVVRALSKVPNPTDEQVDTLRAALGRIGQSPTRLRFAELAVFTAGCERLRVLRPNETVAGPTLGRY